MPAGKNTIAVIVVAPLGIEYFWFTIVLYFQKRVYEDLTQPSSERLEQLERSEAVELLEHLERAAIANVDVANENQKLRIAGHYLKCCVSAKSS